MNSCLDGYSTSSESLFSEWAPWQTISCTSHLSEVSPSRHVAYFLAGEGDLGGLGLSGSLVLMTSAAQVLPLTTLGSNMMFAGLSCNIGLAAISKTTCMTENYLKKHILAAFQSEMHQFNILRLKLPIWCDETSQSLVMPESIWTDQKINARVLRSHHSSYFKWPSFEDIARSSPGASYILW